MHAQILKNSPENTNLTFQKKPKNGIKPPNFNNLYCHQKFTRINDESFLLNINKKADKYYTLNTLDKIVSYQGDIPNNTFAQQYLESDKPTLSPYFDKNLYV